MKSPLIILLTCLLLLSGCSSNSNSYANPEDAVAGFFSELTNTENNLKSFFTQKTLDYADKMLKKAIADENRTHRDVLIVMTGVAQALGQFPESSKQIEGLTPEFKDGHLEYTKPDASEPFLRVPMKNESGWKFDISGATEQLE